uniref:Uncharacterized protein n=1 Tax=Sinocyclocheilus anshuiensis TaxID=1608454 RepID=A0A671RKD7_9TELE
MALRLLVGRVCGVSVRGVPAGVSCSSSFSSRLNASCTSVSFSVQDHDDFTQRVINSQLPVLIDFHAQYVQETAADHSQPSLKHMTNMIRTQSAACLLSLIESVYPVKALLV